MVKNHSSKKSAVVTGRLRRTQTDTLAATRGSRATKPQASNVPSRLPVSDVLLGLTEQEGRKIALTIAANLTSEGVLLAFVCLQSLTLELG